MEAKSLMEVLAAHYDLQKIITLPGTTQHTTSMSTLEVCKTYFKGLILAYYFNASVI